MAIQENLFTSKNIVGFSGNTPSPTVLAAQQAAHESTEFQLWVTQQQQKLSRLKIFNSMAKQINDQQ